MAFSKLAKSFSHRKLRSREEISQEYNEQACQFGHKSRLVKELEAEIARVESEVAGHMLKMVQIIQQSKKMPQEATQAPASAQKSQLSQEQEHA